VDAYGDDEQLTGFYTMIEGNLALPFTTTVLARSGSRAARRGPGDESPDGVAAQLQSAAR